MARPDEREEAAEQVIMVGVSLEDGDDTRDSLAELFGS